MLSEPSAHSAVLAAGFSGRRRRLQNVTAEQSRAARALLNWSRARLGAKSDVSEDTIREFENGNRIPRNGNLTRIRRALEAAGVVFTSGSPSLNYPSGDAV
ncbi:helix-turn-helix transcriptional regulator [Mesorhizobium sp. M1050]|uniref:helix-turn-helix domain-containing protein n=1 Tax=unclassified Mesorhizobium TaxID=325217 RepID=UPI000A024828|nr:helix-turn-helix transcriptional regulator [Mesorhizobium sp. LNHC252B00]